jgi:hypothetical protein
MAVRAPATAAGRDTVDATTALQDLQELVADLRHILRRASANELTKLEAVQRIDLVLGPPVRTDPVKAGHRLGPAVRAYEELVNGCRLALDRLRAGMINDETAFEAIGGLVCGTPYEETQSDVHDMTLKPMPPPRGQRKRPGA